MFLTIKHRKDLRYRYRNKIRNFAILTDKVLQPNRLFNFSTYTPSNLALSKESRIKNICIWSGRCRGIVKFGFSRHALKFFGTRGRFLGLRKTSF